MPESAATPRAVRLIFEYDGDNIQLIHQSAVDVAVTGFDAHPDIRPGRFAEVRDAEGRGLVRVPVRHESGSAEVFPPNAGEPITRVDVEHPKGAFTVIVPAPAETRSVALLDVAAPAAAPTAGAAAPPPLSTKGEETVLAVFDLEIAGEER